MLGGYVAVFIMFDKTLKTRKNLVSFFMIRRDKICNRAVKIIFEENFYFVINIYKNYMDNSDIKNNYFDRVRYLLHFRGQD